MSGQIIGLQDWFKTPAGQYLLGWEQQCLDHAVSDLFGYHALQLGVPELDALRLNRMPHRWIATSPKTTDAAEPMSASSGSAHESFQTDFAALPFASSSLDLVVLPHTLELHVDPHATLREVERVLMPEGRVVICGFNPVSLWGLRQRRAHFYRRLGWGELYLPNAGEFIGYWRLRDWLRLLSFEVESSQFGAYRAAVRSQKWLDRLAWMDGAGSRWWPIFGSAYFLVAVKRVRGMRLLGPAWRSSRAPAAAPVSIANSTQNKDGRVEPR